MFRVMAKITRRS